MALVRVRIAVLMLAAACIAIATAPVQAASDLERAYRVIATKKFVDLTHAFGPDTPVWSGFGQAKFSPAADQDEMSIFQRLYFGAVARFEHQKLLRGMAIAADFDLA